jgi:cytochrome c-type biogenesis protein CcmE
VRGRSIFAIVAITTSLGWVLVGSLQGSLTYYRTPTEMQQERIPPGERMRLGGLVVAGSLRRSGRVSTFEVTDGITTIHVVDTGSTPARFSEGRGVVLEGVVGTDGTFRADTVLVKHDDSYRPPVAAAPTPRTGADA